MRSHSLLFLVLAIILACSNVVLADSPAEGRALNAVEPAVMRSLRTTDEKSLANEGDGDEEEEDDEERFLGLGRLRTKWRLRNMRKSGLKEIKKAEKAATKQDELIKKLLAKYTPVSIQPLLGFNKMADPKTSKYWGFYQAFVAKYQGAKKLEKAALGKLD
ncbi:hypothetical protein PHYBOEH_006624 [Phytophthora boehmeriae]|uniref:RxLR effector protein n=1 Tax=Phytophthora boehmeriae TaxID=109152 RepID=A0A8T1WEP0_9STRA|nr:hypothetical protein PHYBOEH_006624 [Phytophthora boehmeriae]